MLLALTLFLSLLQGIAPAPAPRTLRVGTGEGFATPAAALATARPGDTVRVAAGIYPGALNVSVPRVVLMGEPGAILDGRRNATVVTLSADAAQLVGFTVRNSGRALDHDQAAVKLVRCHGCRVARTRVERSLHGVYLLESDHVLVADNVILGDPQLTEARRGNGIHLFHSVGARLERNRIRGTRDGIYYSFSSRSEVVENDVSGVRYGLHYMYSDDNRFTRNRFTRNAAGAAIMFSSRILFRENTFSQHVGYRAYGILLQTAYQVEARRNRIEGNLVGVFMDMSSGNTFRENSISGNGIGVDLIASAEGNTFSENTIARNRVSVRRPFGTAQNQWSLDGRGNYWGDRDVFDLDGDGIGDRPYRAGDPFASLAATRPVLEVFAGTPAALALAWAEEAFPVFGFPRVEDAAPLIAPSAGAPPMREESGTRRPLLRPALSLLTMLLAVTRARRVRVGPWRMSR